MASDAGCFSGVLDPGIRGATGPRRTRRHLQPMKSLMYCLHISLGASAMLLGVSCAEEETAMQTFYDLGYPPFFHGIPPPQPEASDPRGTPFIPRRKELLTVPREALALEHFDGELQLVKQRETPLQTEPQLGPPLPRPQPERPPPCFPLTPTATAEPPATEEIKKTPVKKTAQVKTKPSPGKPKTTRGKLKAAGGKPKAAGGKKKPARGDAKGAPGKTQPGKTGGKATKGTKVEKSKKAVQPSKKKVTKAGNIARKAGADTFALAQGLVGALVLLICLLSIRPPEALPLARFGVSTAAAAFAYTKLNQWHRSRQRGT